MEFLISPYNTMYSIIIMGETDPKIGRETTTGQKLFYPKIFFKLDGDSQ